MGNFSKVCRLYKLTGTFKIMLSGGIGLIFVNEVMAVMSFLSPESFVSGELLFALNMQYFNGLWLVMILGNLDVGGKTRLLYTSKMRRFVYRRFYPVLGFMAAMVMFLVDLAVKYTAGNHFGAETYVCGGRSVMAAVFIGLGFVIMGLLSVLGMIGGTILLIGVMVFMLAFAVFGKADISTCLPEQLTGNAGTVVIAGVMIILAGTIVFYLLRERAYRKASSPVSGAAKEQAAAEMFYRG